MITRGIGTSTLITRGYGVTALLQIWKDKLTLTLTFTKQLLFNLER